MKREAMVYGYVNGKAVYSRDEFIFERRGFREIISDSKLLEFAKEVTYGWSYAGHKLTFESFYLSDYELNEPYRSLTLKEFERLKEIQAERRAEQERIEQEKEWRYVRTTYWADNSVEETWANKYGEEKRVTVVGAHGDVC